MNTIYKTIPVVMVAMVIGYPLALSGLGLGWEMFGFGLIVAAIVLFLVVEIVVTAINWRKHKTTSDKRLTDASQMLIFNSVVALLLFVFVTWKDIAILSDSNMFLLIWMALNIGALSRLWVPKDDDTKAEALIVDSSEEEKNKEAV